jgi:hypothetical protein
MDPDSDWQEHARDAYREGRLRLERLSELTGSAKWEAAGALEEISEVLLDLKQAYLAGDQKLCDQYARELTVIFSELEDLDEGDQEEGES